MSKSYRKAPQVSPELLPRYQVVMEVLSGELSVSEAARRLQLSRNHFQSLLHRSLAGLISALEARPAGRPKPPAAEQEARQEVERLRRENERLLKQAETTDRLLNVARGLLTIRPGRREARGAKRTNTEDE
jgi:transposase-like protein